MTEHSGPTPARTVADLRSKTTQRSSQQLQAMQDEQIQQAADFGQQYGNALLDGLRSTKNAFLLERDQTAEQVTAEAAAIRQLSHDLTTAAKTSARMAWLPTAAICLLLIAGSWMFAVWKVSTATQVPAATETITRNGQTFEVLTGPNWTTCTHDGRQRPCRPVKEN